MSGYVATLPDESAIDALLERHNNWGRWGAEDELGTLNLVDPGLHVAASRLIDCGESVSLGRPLDVRAAPHNRRPLQHLMTEVPADSGGFPRGTASDWIGLACHGFVTTHVDALCHQSWRGSLYNGHPAESVKTRSGAQFAGVESLAGGLFAPATFYDVPKQRDVPWLNPGEEIQVEDLEACDGATYQPPGSVLVISTGREARARAHGEYDPITEGSPGLSPSVIGWIQERQPSLIVTDVQCDVMAPGGPPHLMAIHVLCLVGLGVHLVDNASLHGLSESCSRNENRPFAFAMGVPRIPRATGAPVNPLAIL